MCVHLALNAAAVSAVGRATIAAVPSGSFADTASPTLMSSNFASGAFAPGVSLVPPVPPFDEFELQAASATAPAPTAPAARTERRVTVRSSIIEVPPIAECCRICTRRAATSGSRLNQTSRRPVLQTVKLGGPTDVRDDRAGQLQRDRDRRTPGARRVRRAGFRG